MCDRRGWLWRLLTFHVCRWNYDDWAFVRHLSEQTTLYRCECGGEYASNHAIGATLPYDANMQAFYASRADCYPPCECQRCAAAPPGGQGEPR